MNALPLFDLKGKRATVMGLGRFGGGVGAAQFLAARGALVTVTDLLPESDLSASLAELRGSNIAGCHLGGHREQDFLDADIVVVNPAVARSNPLLQIAERAGATLTSEMNLFWQHHRGKIAAVTGSNGKSTTTALLYSILKAAGVSCSLGGNIGKSLLAEVDQLGPDDWAVLELSSFQLDDLNRLPASPHLAVVTNFAPNHLDWHGSLGDYRRAKQSILRWQTPDCVAVLNADDRDVASWPVFGRRYEFGLNDTGAEGVFATTSGNAISRHCSEEALLPIGRWLKLPGLHNMQNALAATCAAMAIGASPDAVRQGLEDYEPLRHRLEFVAEVAGRRFYNDSLATTPESTIVALDAFTEPIVLLAGGYDKQVDLTAMAEAISHKAKAVALMGSTSEHLADLIDENPSSRKLPCHECHSLKEAFDWAVAESSAGDVVLLSPGCASYDWFRNFADRGDQFVELVRSWRP
ncbi:MAG: UDP-N-acetylmuramoyl-L-alanine--D-glutamate ligase [Planctomycetaceae bacterium]